MTEWERSRLNEIRYEVVAIAEMSNMEKWNSPLNLPLLTNCWRLIDLKAIFSVWHEKQKPKVSERSFTKISQKSFCDTTAVLLPGTPSWLRLSSTTAFCARNHTAVGYHLPPCDETKRWTHLKFCEMSADQRDSLTWTQCAVRIRLLWCFASNFSKGWKMTLKRCDHIVISQITWVELYTNDRYHSTYFHYCDSDRRGFY
jgi:hypothetical protein